MGGKRGCCSAGKYPKLKVGAGSSSRQQPLGVDSWYTCSKRTLLLRVFYFQLDSHPEGVNYFMS